MRNDYSLLDNFGVQGGRNGFLYIQGVGKQDVAVGILVAFISSPYDWKIIFPRKESRECISVCGVRSEVKVSGLPGSWLRTYRLLLPDLTWVKIMY